MKKFAGKHNEYFPIERRNNKQIESYKSIKKSNKIRDKEMMKSLYLPRSPLINPIESKRSIYNKLSQISNYNNSINFSEVSSIRNSKNTPNSQRHKYESLRSHHQNMIIGESLKKSRNKSTNKKSIMSILTLFDLNYIRKTLRSN